MYGFYMHYSILTVLYLQETEKSVATCVQSFVHVNPLPTISLRDSKLLNQDQLIEEKSYIYIRKHFCTSFITLKRQVLPFHKGNM